MGNWDETPLIGLAFLVFFSLLWLLFDLFRIFRVRRMLLAIEKQNIEKLRKFGAGIGIRKWLKNFAKKVDRIREGEESRSISFKKVDKIDDNSCRISNRSCKAAKLLDLEQLT